MFIVADQGLVISIFKPIFKWNQWRHFYTRTIFELLICFCWWDFGYIRIQLQFVFVGPIMHRKGRGKILSRFLKLDMSICIRLVGGVSYPCIGNGWNATIKGRNWRKKFGQTGIYVYGSWPPTLSGHQGQTTRSIGAVGSDDILHQMPTSVRAVQSCLPRLWLSLLSVVYRRGMTKACVNLSGKALTHIYDWEVNDVGYWG